jgi:hypothetical protein
MRSTVIGLLLNFDRGEIAGWRKVDITTDKPRPK